MIKRRHHPLEFKQQVVAANNRHGASVASVAMAHGINANQLHKWRRELLRPKAAKLGHRLVPVTIEASPISLGIPSTESCTGAIEIELQHTRLTVRGRVDLDALQTVLVILCAR